MSALIPAPEHTRPGADCYRWRGIQSEGALGWPRLCGSEVRMVGGDTEKLQAGRWMDERALVHESVCVCVCVFER